LADKPVVLVTRKLPPNVEARLDRDYRPLFNAEDRLYDTEELLRLADGADAILPCHTESLRAEVIERLPESVRIIATFSVGYDHIDLAAASARGIAVTNTPDVLADATAEITMLLLLGAARRASEGERLVRSGGWNTWSPSFMLGVQVTGKRLGIVGMGRVGQVTARRARGFDMEVHYHNRSELPAEKAHGRAAQCRTHRVAAGRRDRGQCRARQRGRRGRIARGARHGQALRSGSRRVQQRTRHRPRIRPARQPVPAATPGQRDT
jgi:lactate dehydrogenase-like 2-hydroxyacid dehydrogenase